MNHAKDLIQRMSRREANSPHPHYKKTNTMKAIKITGPGEAEIQDVPIPALRDDYVLVRVKAVALNPTDW